MAQTTKIAALVVASNIATGQKSGFPKNAPKDFCQKPGTSNNLRCGPTDCTMMYQWLLAKEPKSNVQLIINPNNQKNDYLNHLEQLFRRDTECYVAYYSGHGRGGMGDWCVDSNGNFATVTFDEVYYRASNRRNKSSPVLVIMDSCYSGVWAKKAKNKGGWFHVWASCGDDQVSYGGALGSSFTRTLVMDISNFQYLREDVHKNLKKAQTRAQMYRQYPVCSVLGEFYTEPVLSYKALPQLLSETIMNRHRQYYPHQNAQQKKAGIPGVPVFSIDDLLRVDLSDNIVFFRTNVNGNKAVATTKGSYMLSRNLFNH